MVDLGGRGSLKWILRFYKDFNQFLHFSIKHNKMTQFDETNSGDDQNDMTTKDDDEY